jgi:hypothetical protein
LFALPAGAVLLQQQIAESLFEAVDHVHDRVAGQISRQAELLVGLEGGSEALAAGEEVPRHDAMLYKFSSGGILQIATGYLQILSFVAPA